MQFSDVDIIDFDDNALMYVYDVQSHVLLSISMCHAFGVLPFVFENTERLVMIRL